MNTEKLFEAAKAAGIELFEARITENNALELETFNTEIEKYTVADDATFTVRGVVNGKTGVFTSDRTDDGVIDLAVAAVKESAEYGAGADKELFVKGGQYEYCKVDTFFPELEKTPEFFTDMAKRIAERTLKADKRIENTSVQIEYVDKKYRLINSVGLDLKSHANYIGIFASVKATDGKEVQSNSHYEFVSDLSKFDEAAFVKTLVAGGVEMLGGVSAHTGKFTVVFAPTAVGAFISTLGSSFSAFNAEKHMSLLEGKIGTKVFSDKLTVLRTPIGSDIYCKAFDAEGVPTQNGLLIDKGVPTGYVYDLATAKRAGVKSTGSGSLVGGNIRPAVGYVTVKNGELNLDGLFKAVGDGFYITELAGAHAGLSAQTGNYSLQASGYIIRNGKKSAPVALMTVAGNIMKDFANIVAVGNDGKLTYHAVKTPSIAVADVSVSGVNKIN